MLERLCVGFRQHDCQEFLALLLDSLHEQLIHIQPTTKVGIREDRARVHIIKIIYVFVLPPPSFFTNYIFSK